MKRIKRLLSRKNKMGISLIETVVALMLTVMLVTTLSSMITPLNKGYAKAENTRILGSVASLIMEGVASTAMGCKKIYVYTNQSLIQTSNNMTNKVQVILHTVSGTTYLSTYKYNGTKGIYNDSAFLMTGSYNGCSIKSFSITCFKISGEKVATNEEAAKGKNHDAWRGMTITMTLVRTGVEYSISRSFRIYNLAFYEDSKLDYTSEIYTYTTQKGFTTTVPKDASTTYKSFIYMPQGVSAL